MKKYLLVALIACSSVAASNNDRLPIQKSSLSISQFGGVSVLGGINTYADEKAYFHNQTAIVYQRRLYKSFSIVVNLGVNTWRDQNTHKLETWTSPNKPTMVFRNYHHSLYAGLGFNYGLRITRNSQLNFTIIGNYHSRFSRNSVVVNVENYEGIENIRRDIEENFKPTESVWPLSLQLVFNPNITGRIKKLRLRKELRWQAGLYGAYSRHKPLNTLPAGYYIKSTTENYLAVGVQLGLVYAW